MEQKMRELIEKLNTAADAYYNSGKEIMSNLEYDTMFDELAELEKQTGIYFPDSPTQRVGAKAEVEGRVKITHEFPARSLDKTKEREELARKLGEKEGVLSWKLDGQTVVVTYENGKLKSAVTRGNGEIGVDVTDVAEYMDIPLEIPYAGKLVARGECLMSYAEFERINEQIEKAEDKYKNPRNLAVGTLNALDEEIHRQRKIHWIAFQLVYGENLLPNDFRKRLEILKTLGMDIVPYVSVTRENLAEAIEKYEEKVAEYEYPTDGLVLAYTDVAYGESLGMTGHHPKHSIAFKWADECEETKIIDIEWSPSKTGLLNPVAIFEPVEIEGTTVQRASVHNVSILKKLKLGKGDRIMVYKANMIIPQISENLDNTGSFLPPEKCPVCGGTTKIVKSENKEDNEVETLYCANPDCICKMIGRLEHFVSKNALNIEGISGKKIELLYENGFITDFCDFYHLSDHMEQILKLDGFGAKALENLLESVKNSREVELKNFINALSIPMVGKDTSSLIANTVKTVEGFLDMLEYPEVLSDVNGIGEVIIEEIHNWANDKNKNRTNLLLQELKVKEVKEAVPSGLSGKTFVITGSVNHFKNRDELKDFIEKNGGKVAGSVSKNTSYLINNDVDSTSGKNKKAKELGIPIINEETFLKML